MDTLFPTLLPPRENALTAGERNALVLSCEPLCRWVVRKLTAGVAGADQDDLEQEALVACCEAAKRWRPDAGTKFSTYAIACVERHVAGVVARIRCESTTHVEDGDSIPDTREATEVELADRPAVVLTEEQEEALFRLPEDQHTAVCMVLHGASPDQIADRLGRSVKDVKLIIRNAARDLRRSLAWLSRPDLFGGGE